MTRTLPKFTAQSGPHRDRPGRSIGLRWFDFSCPVADTSSRPSGSSRISRLAPGSGCSSASAASGLESRVHQSGHGGGRNLWFIPQLGAGPIAPSCRSTLADQERPGRQRIDITLNAPGADRFRLSDTAVGHAADFGTLFCALAGLMNIAVALDAGRRPAEDRRTEDRS